MPAHLPDGSDDERPTRYSEITIQGCSSSKVEHWSIENELHYVRDWAYDEDRSQVRVGNAPRVLATIRNLAISIIRIVTNRTMTIPTATRHLGRHPDLTLDFLGIP